MEVSTGYKRTEVGVIPEEWGVDAIGDAFDISGGLSASREQLSSNGHCYLHYGDIHKSKKSFINVRTEYLDIPKLAIPLSQVPLKSILTDGDVVFIDASEDDEGTSKHVVIINPEAIPYIAGLHTIVAKSKSTSFDNAYKRYCFQTRDLRRQFLFYAVGTKVSGISKTNIKKVFIPRPPLSEQRAIAATLSDAEALLGALEQIITKKRDLKQGAMQQLLTGQIRLPGFQGEWEEKRLDQLGAWNGGMTPSMQNPSYWQGGDVPWISSGDVKSVLLKETGFSITTAAVRQGTTTLLPANSIVVVTRSGILRKYLPVGMNVIPMAINQDIKALIPTEKFCSTYLLHALIGNGDQILARCLKAGTTVESIEFRWLKAYTIPVPPLPEQIAIAKVLSDMDAELAALEHRREKTWALKQGMMQALLTGRTRLI